mgnify:CR=1 FL=1
MRRQDRVDTRLLQQLPSAELLDWCRTSILRDESRNIIARSHRYLRTRERARERGISIESERVSCVGVEEERRRERRSEEEEQKRGDKYK